MESGGNFEDYIRFLSCHLFGPVNHGHLLQYADLAQPERRALCELVGTINV